MSRPPWTRRPEIRRPLRRRQHCRLPGRHRVPGHRLRFQRNALWAAQGAPRLHARRRKSHHQPDRLSRPRAFPGARIGLAHAAARPPTGGGGSGEGRLAHLRLRNGADETDYDVCGGKSGRRWPRLDSPALPQQPHGKTPVSNSAAAVGAASSARIAERKNRNNRPDRCFYAGPLSLRERARVRANRESLPPQRKVLSRHKKGRLSRIVLELSSLRQITPWVPLLACPAVDNDRRGRHCWTSQQWHPFATPA